MWDSGLRYNYYRVWCQIILHRNIFGETLVLAMSAAADPHTVILIVYNGKTFITETNLFYSVECRLCQLAKKLVRISRSKRKRLQTIGLKWNRPLGLRKSLLYYSASTAYEQSFSQLHLGNVWGSQPVLQIVNFSWKFSWPLPYFHVSYVRARCWRQGRKAKMTLKRIRSTARPLQRPTR